MNDQAEEEVHRRTSPLAAALDRIAVRSWRQPTRAGCIRAETSDAAFTEPAMVVLSRGQYAEHADGSSVRRVEDGTMAVVPATRVLVVGDEPRIGYVLGELLSRGGYEVQHANHAAAPSLMATKSKEAFPDVAILDTGRHSVSTVSVLEFIRGTMDSSLPVIVLTANATEEHEAEYQRLGVNQLLWKPVSAAELLSAVAEAAS